MRKVKKKMADITEKNIVLNVGKVNSFFASERVEGIHKYFSPRGTDLAGPTYPIGYFIMFVLRASLKRKSPHKDFESCLADLLVNVFLRRQVALSHQQPAVVTKASVTEIVPIAS